MDDVKAAARLSAALGRKIRPEDVEYVHDAYVCLGPGKIYELYAGNACYAGDGHWWKNGTPWEKAGEERNEPRPLNLQ
jgi:hypothetical protein